MKAFVSRDVLMEVPEGQVVITEFDVKINYEEIKADGPREGSPVLGGTDVIAGERLYLKHEAEFGSLFGDVVDYKFVLIGVEGPSAISVLGGTETNFVYILVGIGTCSGVNTDLLIAQCFILV